MLRELLRERFMLHLVVETRDLPIFALSMARSDAIRGRSSIAPPSIARHRRFRTSPASRWWASAVHDPVRARNLECGRSEYDGAGQPPLDVGRPNRDGPHRTSRHIRSLSEMAARSTARGDRASLDVGSRDDRRRRSECPFDLYGAARSNSASSSNRSGVPRRCWWWSEWKDRRSTELGHCPLGSRRQGHDPSVGPGLQTRASSTSLTRRFSSVGV